MRVIDASVLGRALWRPVDSAVAIIGELAETPYEFAVPELFLFESYSVLARVLPNGLDTYRQIVLPIMESGINRIPMTEELRFSADKFVHMGLAGNDACYAGLADQLGCKWLTFDAKAHTLIADAGVCELLEG